MKDQLKYILSFMKEIKGILVLDLKFTPVFSSDIEKEMIPQNISQYFKNNTIKYYDSKNHLLFYGFPLTLPQSTTSLYYFLTVSDTKNIEKSIGLTMNRILIYILLTQISFYYSFEISNHL